jgi:branched-chain amino acid transport system permease protein
MDYTSQTLQYVISGITLGSIYALIALGLTVIHNTTNVMNMAQGEFAVWGGFALVILCTNLGLPLPLGFILGMAGVFIVGIIIDRLVMFRLRGALLLTLFVATLAVSYTMLGSALLVFGKEPRAFPGFSGEASLEFLGAFISPQVLWILGFICVASLGLWFFFNHTIYGKAMKACSQDRIAARAMGINPDRMTLLSWGMSGALGASAGALVIPITLMNFSAGGLFLIKGLAAAVLGGTGSYPGAVLGGFAIGLFESIGAGFVSPMNKDIFAMASLFVVLLIRPSGIFGIRGE